MIRRTKCCAKLKCFTKVNYNFLVMKCRELLGALTTHRELLLRSFLEANNIFFLNGSPVCLSFLQRSFHFSSVLISKLRGTSKGNSVRFSINRNLPVLYHASTYSNTKWMDRSSPRKDAILSFLKRFSDDCSDMMPDKNEYHLPFFQNSEVYEQFVVEYSSCTKTIPQLRIIFFQHGSITLGI